MLKKLQFSAVVLAVTFTFQTSFAQSSDGGYAITDRGADWRVLSQTTVENGTNRVHQYTELASGLNYRNSAGQWTESKEQIAILPTGGAAATQGRHQVYFPADIYNGVLEVVTPDGKHLKSRPLGVSYDDGSNAVWIALLKHSQGWLTRSNQVTYPDAFTEFKADLVCTYKRGGFECDLVFRQQPPTPDAYGLDAGGSTLQMVTEFFNTQDPTLVPGQSDDWYGLQDKTLKFGSLTMTRGKAFKIGSQTTEAGGQGEGAAAVYKTWTHISGRTFLIEEVPLQYLADELNTLPDPASGQVSSVRPPSADLRFLSSSRKLPPAREFAADTNQIQVATIDFNKQPGVVLDYDEITTDQTDFTFQSDMTYYISSAIYFDGTTTFEAGTVVKFPEDGSSGLFCNTNIVWPADSGHPAIFTSKNDNLVGQTIASSSGTPSMGSTIYIY